MKRTTRAPKRKTSTRPYTAKPAYKKAAPNPLNTIHKFKRSFDAGLASLVTTPAVFTGVGFNFSLTDLPNYTELTALYDFYKITGVRFRAIPYEQTEGTSTSAVTNARNAPIFYAVDRSDSTAPTNSGDILQYNDHKISNFFRGFDIYISNPCYADATSSQRNDWVATSSPNVDWYGLKVGIPGTGVSANLYVVMTYYVSFKDTK